jgi:hypothetical protein
MCCRQLVGNGRSKRAAVFRPNFRWPTQRGGPRQMPPRDRFDRWPNRLVALDTARRSRCKDICGRFNFFLRFESPSRAASGAASRLGSWRRENGLLSSPRNWHWGMWLDGFRALSTGMAGHKSVALRLLRRTPQSLQRVLTRLHFLVARVPLSRLGVTVTSAPCKVNSLSENKDYAVPNRA